MRIASVRRSAISNGSRCAPAPAMRSSAGSIARVTASAIMSTVGAAIDSDIRAGDVDVGAASGSIARTRGAPATVRLRDVESRPRLITRR